MAKIVLEKHWNNFKGNFLLVNASSLIYTTATVILPHLKFVFTHAC